MSDNYSGGKTTFRFTLPGAHAWRLVATTAIFSLVAQTAAAAPITVNSLADDVFMNATGQTFSDAALTVPVSPAYCTLRMAITAANLDTVVGGCAAGSGADTIDFSAALNLTTATPGTITLSQVSMFEAPANYNSIPPTWLLAISTPITISGPAAGGAALTINGGGLGTTAIGRRTLIISDSQAAVDMPVSISRVSFKEGRNVGGGGGCVFSRESLTLSDVVFEACEAVGAAPNSTVGGGALGVNVTGVGDVRPNVTLSNVRFTANRSTHGAASGSSAVGAASFGSSTPSYVGDVSISDTSFFGNSAESVGALRIQNANSASLLRLKIGSNTATSATGQYGGFVISTVSGTVALTNVYTVANIAGNRRAGGGIFTVGANVTSGDAVTITDSAFIGNFTVGAVGSTGGDIGGLDVSTDFFDANGNCTYSQLRNVRMTGVEIRENHANKSVGGMRLFCSGNAALTDMSFSNNQVEGLNTTGSGGNSAALLVDLATVTVDNIRIESNRTYGGTITPPATNNGGYGVFTVQGPPSFSPSVTYPLAHSFTGTRLLFKDNYAYENEAGLSLRPNGAGRNYSVSNSSFVGNHAKGITGLFLNATGNYSVSNTTLSGNNSSAGSGPLFINVHASTGTNGITINGVTSARNSSTSDPISVGQFNPAGGASTPSAAIDVKNTIFGQYQYQNGYPGYWPVQAGVTYNVANSIIEGYYAPNQPSGICGVSGVICNADAKLEGLADNGGSVTTYTHALRPGSPALDAGDGTGAPAFDQRGSGFPRVVNSTIDIGAFESPVLTAALPCKLDMDGDNQVRANKEGLVLLRSMLGFTGAAVVNGTGISQAQWDSARNNLNANCGTSFAP